jgi:hypothetical protein
MRIAAFGFLLGSATLASLPTSLFIQGGALAILAWTVWYLLACAIPTRDKQHREERKMFIVAQEALTHSLDRLTVALMKRD